MGRVSLALENNISCYEPGAQLIATADWDLDKPANEIVLRLQWQTSGKGDTDSSIVQEVSFDNPEPRGQKRLGIQLPDSPYSFSGSLVSLIWTIELVVLPSGETDRVDITLAPGGQEILLGGAEKSAAPMNDHDDDDDDYDEPNSESPR